MTETSTAPRIVRSREEIQAILAKAHEATELLPADQPAGAYNRGVAAMYQWLTGYTDERPEA